MVTLLAVIHAAVAVLAARVSFGRVRTRILETDGEGYHELSAQARVQGAGILLTLVSLAGLWPLILAIGLVMARPPKTPTELREEARERDRRIADLERQLGIRP